LKKYYYKNTTGPVTEFVLEFKPLENKNKDILYLFVKLKINTSQNNKQH